MSTLAEMLRDTTDLEPAESEWLHLLAGDWQLISDLSFADLVLWVRGGMDGWRAVATWPYRRRWWRSCFTTPAHRRRRRFQDFLTSKSHICRMCTYADLAPISSSAASL